MELDTLFNLSCLKLSCFEFTYQLCHVAHRAEHAPGSWTIDNGEQNAHNQRGEHDAVETEGKLRLPWLNLYRVSPMPWHVEGP